MTTEYSILTLDGPILTADVPEPWVPGALIGKYVCVLSGTLATQSFPIADNGADWISIPVACQGTLNGDLTMLPAGYNWFNGGAGPAIHEYHTTGGLFGGRAYLKIWGNGPYASNIYGSVQGLPGSGTLGCYIRCRCSGQRSNPYWLSAIGNGFWTDLNTSGVDDWVWRPYSFTLANAGYTNFVIGGYTGTYYGDYPDVIEAEICGVTINGYIDLSQLGFAVGNIFTVSTTRICCVNFAPNWNINIGPPWTPGV